MHLDNDLRHLSSGKIDEASVRTVAGRVRWILRLRFALSLVLHLRRCMELGRCFYRGSLPWFKFRCRVQPVVINVLPY